LANYLGKQGFSIFPRDSVNYTTEIINQVLSRRRQHLERRNDFIQMMVDREEETEPDQQINQETDKQQQWGTLKKSINKIFSNTDLLFNFSFE
jgi:ABC-type amino acid transport substrate-binding protein